MPQGASHVYTCGWEDADTELLETERHRRVLAKGGEDDIGSTWGVLFDAGEDARAYGLGLNETRTGFWKEGWIDTDINLGVHEL